ncbi:MAG: Ca-activated chloride channel [Solirubrobacteraceae bacterium]|jgi:Ca-activated chloride channel family protein|nr:Ca-activated chloride channel [Solirubrobacteraceae bacterium]
MKKSQLALIAVAVAAVALIAVFAGGGKKDGASSGGGGGGGAQTAPAGATKVTFAYSPEKEALLKPLIASFNASAPEAGGTRIFVAGENVSSGDAQLKIANGTYKPTAWTPSSSMWGRLLNYEADQPYAPDDPPSIVRTPLVIAMWEPMAKALGYPRRKLGFADVLKLARSNQGWAAYGHPEYGQFKLVHTNPDFSTSGLEAVVAEYYAATGKKEGLLGSDIAGARPQVKDIERSIVHYGDTTLFIADQLRKSGPGYASAVAMEEATLVDFNQHRGSQPKLVAIYPREGTFFSDNPYIVLRAPWVSAAQKAGAERFGSYLADNVDAAKAARYGFRPADLNAKPEAPLTAANGVDPAQPARVLGLPEPRVLAALKKAWRLDRKPANVLLVLDTSGSMNEENRLANAKSGLLAFLAQVEPQDRIGLTIFSDRIQPLAPIAPARSNRAQVRGLVSNLIADGGTAIYDATAAGVAQVAKLADQSRINAVVLLTDGEDTDSTRNVDAVVRELEGQGDSSKRVRVFTIAYSAGAAGAADNLARIAEASGGKAYVGKTSDIESVYRSISSFF